MANPSPQHNPTDGLGTATQITLVSGGGAALTSIVAGREYSASLSLGGTNTVTLTSTVKDVGGNAFTSGNGNAVAFKSYNTNQATVNASTGVVTGVAAGQAVIEASFPTADTTDGVDKIYVQVLVTVGV